MKPPYVYAFWALVSAACLLLAPSPGMSQPDQTSPEEPQTEQTWVREGSFAVKLASALKLLNTDNEAEAMRELSWFKVEPRGGWIADQPVTPGILRELRRDKQIHSVGVTKGTRWYPGASLDNCNSTKSEP